MGAEQLRLLAVHAHPDDESSKGAATMAKYAAEGARVKIATCTGGERGSVLNPKADLPGARAAIARLRRAEMAQACRILGAEHTWLGFVDSGLPEGNPPPLLPFGCFGRQDPRAAARPLISLVRQFRPHVMTTYDENGGYPHPDHIMCHKISMLAFNAAGDPKKYPELGAPWQPLKLYYSLGWTHERMRTLHQGMVAEGLQSPYLEWLETWADRRNRGERTVTRIQCADYFEVRDDALRAHATQIDPDGFWFRIPLDMQRALWPTEEFELARSLVATPTCEQGLFDGLHALTSV